ncbi:MAG: SDR family oxidoreductase [Gammaproteobacteria bacterium]|nr:SDR family oxidoreductase [Gammaproteobacteria bacterium]MYD00978.1 SDR family oxidoreductase [Gammaproteobacteria bacterium]MYI24512.1 SDR family oxidoreductase [Gammaproteobacteria bacterium]
MRTFISLPAAVAASLLIAVSGQVAPAEAEEAAAEGDMKPLVLVAGATGKTGTLVVQQLQAKGYPVRAFVRNSAKAVERLGADVEAVVGDLKDPASIAAALDGVGAVINTASASGGPENSAEHVDFEGARNLAEAALAAGVGQYVLVSSRGVTDDDHYLNRMFNNILIWKRRGEEAVAASGIPYTIVRPGGLSDDPGGKQTVIFEQGDTQSEGIWITRADVARVCVSALAHEAALNKVFEIHAEDGEAQADFAAEFSSLSAS